MSLFSSLIFIVTSVVPSSSTKSDILSMSLIELMLNTISLTGLLKRSLRDRSDVSRVGKECKDKKKMNKKLEKKV